jgi:hypothetical protein
MAVAVAGGVESKCQATDKPVTPPPVHHLLRPSVPHLSLLALSVVLLLVLFWGAMMFLVCCDVVTTTTISIAYLPSVRKRKGRDIMVVRKKKNIKDVVVCCWMMSSAAGFPFAVRSRSLVLESTYRGKCHLW